MLYTEILIRKLKTTVDTHYSGAIALQYTISVRNRSQTQDETMKIKDRNTLIKSPPWIMKSLITRWKVDPLYPIGISSRLYSPVQNWRKFSQVLGTTSANSSIIILPISCNKDDNDNEAVLNKIQKETNHRTVVPTLISRNTTGLLGLRSWDWICVHVGGISEVIWCFAIKTIEHKFCLNVKTIKSNTSKMEERSVFTG